MDDLQASLFQETDLLNFTKIISLARKRATHHRPYSITFIQPIPDNAPLNTTTTKTITTTARNLNKHGIIIHDSNHHSNSNHYKH